MSYDDLRMARRSLGVIAPAFLVSMTLALSGCFLFREPRTEGVGIDNQTNQTIDVFTASPVAGELRLVTLTAGEATVQDGILDDEGCTTVDLIARAADGTEVDRMSAPLCRGDSWVIDND